MFLIVKKISDIILSSYQVLFAKKLLWSATNKVGLFVWKAAPSLFPERPAEFLRQVIGLKIVVFVGLDTVVVTQYSQLLI